MATGGAFSVDTAVERDEGAALALRCRRPCICDGKNEVVLFGVNTVTPVYKRPLCRRLLSIRDPAASPFILPSCLLTTYGKNWLYKRPSLLSIRDRPGRHIRII